MNTKLTDSEISLLHWAFSKNEHFSDWIQDISEIRQHTWIRYSEELTDIHQLPIHGLQDKLADVGCHTKLLPILSELRAAKEFAKRGFKVELVKDNDCRFRGNQQSPDLLVETGETKIWIEVMRKFSDSIDSLLYEKLTPILEAKDFALTISYSTSLSTMATNKEEKEQKERVVEKFIQDLTVEINSLKLNELPCSFILSDAEIYIEQAKSGWGGVSFCDMPLNLIPTEKCVKQIKDSVQRKASKRKKWKGNLLANPFLILLDIESSELYNVIYRSLYGSGNYIDWLKPDEFGPKRVIYPEVVRDRLNGDQRELIRQLGFDSRRHLYIASPGIFVTEEDVQKNVSGVIAMINERVECFPNPFCDREICLPNLPSILNIPLTDLISDELRKPI